MLLSIINSYHLRGVEFKGFYKLFKLAPRIIPKFRVGDVNLYFVSDQRIKTLNCKYRKLAKVTDVLSFAYLGEEFGDEVIGEIFIAVPRVKKQAREFAYSLTQELLLLFAHGLLHIYGYEHANEKESRVVKSLEDKLLIALS